VALTVIAPPRTKEELLARASALRGYTLGALSDAIGFPVEGDSSRTKGKVGELVERALGATGGASATHDFPHLGVELKTIPTSEQGKPRESTYVCTLAVAEADRAEWSTSWARAKLSCVLWLPIVIGRTARERTIGAPLLWWPTPEQENVLQADFDEVMGTIGSGGIEGVTARMGRWLQVRPKARDGAPRATAWGADGARIATVPRGFYLRALFTGALLRDPEALP
jgi:DNA mismatch repair protein MutH